MTKYIDKTNKNIYDDELNKTLPSKDKLIPINHQTYKDILHYQNVHIDENNNVKVDKTEYKQSLNEIKDNYKDKIDFQSGIKRTKFISVGQDIKTEYSFFISDINDYKQNGTISLFLRKFAEQKKLTLEKAIALIEYNTEKYNKKLLTIRTLRLEYKEQINRCSNPNEMDKVYNEFLNELKKI